MQCKNLFCDEYCSGCEGNCAKRTITGFIDFYYRISTCTKRKLFNRYMAHIKNTRIHADVDYKEFVDKETSKGNL